jgi:LacI family transcriptional regulator
MPKDKPPAPSDKPSPERDKPPTLKDIAAAAGVSASTVSLALKSHPGIPEPTRLRVMAAAERMGYQRDANLSRLMSYLRHSHKKRDFPVIAYVANTPQPEFWRVNPYNRQLLKGLTERANQLGYKVEEFWVSDKKGGYRQKSLSRVLRARGIENVIIDPHDDMRYDDFDLKHFAAAATAPYDVTDPPIHRATLYREETVYETFLHLHQQGYRRIGFLTKHIDEADIDLVRPFLAGYLTYQQLLADPENRIPFHANGPGEELDSKSIRNWLEEYRPEVFLFMGGPVMHLLKEYKMKVPDDIAVAYIDWVPEQVPLAGINQRRNRTAAHAIELVDAQFRRNERGYPERAKVVFVKGVWVPGATVPEPAAPAGKRARSRPSR